MPRFQAVPIRGIFVRSSLRRLVVCLIIANLIAVVIYSAGHRRSLNADDATTERVAVSMAKPAPGFPYGIMSESDYEELHRIGLEAHSPQPFPDSDFNFLMAVFTQSPPHQHDNYNIADVNVMAILLDKANLTPSQRSRIFDVALPLLSQEDYPGAGNLGNIKGYACHVLGDLRDKRAVPYILPLLKDNRSYVRFNALRALRLMGYNLSAAPQ
jgi:hypothetical protein